MCEKLADAMGKNDGLTDITELATVRRKTYTIPANGSIDINGYGFHSVCTETVNYDYYCVFAVGYGTNSLNIIAKNGSISVSKNSNSVGFTLSNSSNTDINVVVTKL